MNKTLNIPIPEQLDPEVELMHVLVFLQERVTLDEALRAAEWWVRRLVWHQTIGLMMDATGPPE